AEPALLRGAALRADHQVLLGGYDAEPRCAHVLWAAAGERDHRRLAEGELERGDRLVRDWIAEVGHGVLPTGPALDAPSRGRAPRTACAPTRQSGAHMWSNAYWLARSRSYPHAFLSRRPSPTTSQLYCSRS